MKILEELQIVVFLSVCLCTGPHKNKKQQTTRMKKVNLLLTVICLYYELEMTK